MRGKGWLAATIGVGLLAGWRVLDRGRRADALATPEAELAAASRLPATVGERIEPLEPLDSFQPPDTTLDVAPLVRRADAPPDENLTVASGSTVRIHGHARDQYGEPLAQNQVWLVQRATLEDVDARYPSLGAFEEKNVVERAWTDLSGAYELENVAPGTWCVGIPNLWSVGGTGTSLYPLAVFVQTRPGDQDREVDLVAYRRITIQGTVVTPEGKPATGADVEVTATEGGPNLVTPVIVDEEGRFEIGPLPAGQVLVQASFRGKFLPSERVRATAGEEDVRLQLVHGGRLVVTLVDSEARHPLVEALTVRRRVGADGEVSDPHEWKLQTSGQAELDGLEAGLYDLVAHASKGRIGILRRWRVEADPLPQEAMIRVDTGAKLEFICRGRRTGFDLELDSDDVLVGDGVVDSRSPRSFLVPAGRVRIRVDVPTAPDSNLHIRTDQGVKWLEVVLEQREQRTVDLGGG